MYFAPLFLAAWLAVVAGAEPAQSPERPKPSVDPVEAELERAANLEFAQQQAWLRQLQDRAAGAARATLGPEAAAKEGERIYRLLHQERVTFAALRELLTETLRRERAAAPAPSLALRPSEETASRPAVDAPLPAKREPSPANRPLPKPVEGRRGRQHGRPKRQMGGRPNRWS